MYGRIKIECSLSDPDRWDNVLPMIGSFDEDTGEILSFRSDCWHFGCRFKKIPSSIVNLRYIFQGSLANFYNKGEKKSTDFTFDQVKKTISDLENDYSIDPKCSKVRNFEFGVNIKLPAGMDAATFLRYFVASQFRGFEEIDRKRPKIGYVAEFNEYSIRIYNKGYLNKSGETDLIRFEIKVTRPRWLDQYKFIKGKSLLLSDLLYPANIKILGDILKSKVRSLIIVPRNLDISKLSHKQTITYYECRNTRSWEGWNGWQRIRKQEQMTKIFQKVGQPNFNEILLPLVISKWEEVTR